MHFDIMRIDYSSCSKPPDFLRINFDIRPPAFLLAYLKKKRECDREYDDEAVAMPVNDLSNH